MKYLAPQDWVVGCHISFPKHKNFNNGQFGIFNEIIVIKGIIDNIESHSGNLVIFIKLKNGNITQQIVSDFWPDWDPNNPGSILVWKD